MLTLQRTFRECLESVSFLLIPSSLLCLIQEIVMDRCFLFHLSCIPSSCLLTSQEFWFSLLCICSFALFCFDFILFFDFFFFVDIPPLRCAFLTPRSGDHPEVRHFSSFFRPSEHDLACRRTLTRETRRLPKPISFNLTQAADDC